MSQTKPSNHWNATRLRANLATAIRATAESAQIVEVDGQVKAVLVHIDEWRALRSGPNIQDQLNTLWIQLANLQRTYGEQKQHDDSIANEDSNANNEFERMTFRDPFVDAS